jgi:hypothetical protein
MVSVDQAYSVVVSVEDGVEDLHKQVTDDEEVFLSGLVNGKGRDSGTADTLTVWSRLALVPVVGWN